MSRLSVILALVQMVRRTIINVDRDIIHPLVVRWREEEASKKTGSGGASTGGAAAVAYIPDDVHDKGEDMAMLVRSTGVRSRIRRSYSFSVALSVFLAGTIGFAILATSEDTYPSGLCID